MTPPINNFGILNTRRHAVQTPAWADDTIHYEAPESPIIKASSEQPEEVPQPIQTPPPRSTALYRNALRKHEEAVRNIQKQMEQAGEV